MTTENFRFIRTIGDNVRVRRITSSDRTEYAALLNTGKRKSETFEDYEIQDFGLEADGAPAGAMSLILMDDHVVVTQLFVKEEDRLLGYGSRLLVKAKETALEAGFTNAAFELDPKRKDLIRFFNENGFFEVESEEDEGIALVWDEAAELFDRSEFDAEEATKAAETMPPFLDVIVPKLMRLKEFLQRDGIDTELVSGEKTYLWLDFETYDIQISYLPADSSLREFALIFSSFVKTERSPEETQKLCQEFNAASFFATAIPTEGAIMLRYAFPETAVPVNEITFLSMLSEFCSETEKAYARIEE